MCGNYPCYNGTCSFNPGYISNNYICNCWNGYAGVSCMIKCGLGLKSVRHELSYICEKDREIFKILEKQMGRVEYKNLFFRKISSFYFRNTSFGVCLDYSNNSVDIFKTTQNYSEVSLDLSFFYSFKIFLNLF